MTPTLTLILALSLSLSLSLSLRLRLSLSLTLTLTLPLTLPLPLTLTLTPLPLTLTPTPTPTPNQDEAAGGGPYDYLFKSRPDILWTVRPHYLLWLVVHATGALLTHGSSYALLATHCPLLTAHCSSLIVLLLLTNLPANLLLTN